MAEGAPIQVIGADHLSSTLKAAGASLGDLSQPSQAAGAMVVSAARARAPKRTGALAGSIVARSIEGGTAVRPQCDMQASFIGAGQRATLRRNHS
jgi:hypothetical protein